jgi:hypothetical protein
MISSRTAFAHNNDLARFRRAIDDEASELSNFARSLRARTQTRPGAFDRPIDDMKSALKVADAPAEAEGALEICGRQLRRRWLDAASSAANRSYRSPTTAQFVATATGHSTNFGYERELQPTELEQRCTSFFGSAPDGWTVDHALVSSGQAAMATVLHLLDSLKPLGDKRPLSIAHLGAYFETTEILALFSSLLKVIASGREALTCEGKISPEIVLIEPIFCDGKFGDVDIAALSRKLCRARTKAKIVIFDDTLIGAANHPEDDLKKLQAISPSAVLRLSSGLKLLQGGLELANVGIISIYTPVTGPLHAANIGAVVRKIRALLGLGLRLADVAALEAPWFLDRDHTDKYQDAVFANNASLAAALADSGKFFENVSHPVLDCARGGAPFCVFGLRDKNLQAYDRLERLVKEESQKRKLHFEQGGSFGFRGHRFEVVRPDNTAPFLRVAMGRRPGWSLEGVVALLRELP